MLQQRSGPLGLAAFFHFVRNHYGRGAEGLGMKRTDIIRALEALDRMPISRASREYLEAERALIRILAALEKEAAGPSNCSEEPAAKHPRRYALKMN